MKEKEKEIVKEYIKVFVEEYFSWLQEKPEEACIFIPPTKTDYIYVRISHRGEDFDIVGCWTRSEGDDVISKSTIEEVAKTIYDFEKKSYRLTRNNICNSQLFFE